MVTVAIMAAAEGTRMSKLRDAVNKTLDGALGSVSRDDFLACFPELVHTHEAVLTELYQQLVASVRPNVLVRYLKPPPQYPAHPRGLPATLRTKFSSPAFQTRPLSALPRVPDSDGSCGRCAARVRENLRRAQHRSETQRAGSR